MKFSLFEQKNIFEKIFYIIVDLPFTVVRDLTIPACDEFKFKKVILMLNVILSPVFVILITERIIFYLKKVNQTGN